MKCYFNDLNTIVVELDTNIYYEIYEDDILLINKTYTNKTYHKINTNIFKNYYIKINNEFIEIEYDGLYDSDEFNQFNYKENLGVIITNQINFSVWAPKKNKIDLIIYKENKEITFATIKENGVFKANISLDYLGYFYKYKIYNKYNIVEAIDPYANCIINNQAYLIDYSTTINVNNIKRDISYNNHIIYELHISDYTANNKLFKNKYLGIIENINHIINLGITDIQLLPIYDFESNDDYNWGYMPLNYNSLSSKYSMNEFNKINEFKYILNTLHNNNIGVIMDVVYNHTSFNHSFNSFVPGYYYRKKDNNYSNASGCGNEIASTRYMCRKYIIDSVCFWAKEYKLSGFRFDLMTILDYKTYEILIDKLKQINKDILVYGEPWSATPPLLDNNIVTKSNIGNINIFYFNDTLRDLIKGNVFDEKSIGFIQGDYKNKKSLFNELNKLSINYVSCHDNHTLYDKLRLTSCENVCEMQKQANAIILLSLGITFLHSGVELCRTKNFIENSYNSSIEINKIDFSNTECLQFYINLINFKKKYNFISIIYLDLHEYVLSYILNDLLILHNTNIKSYISFDKEYTLIFHNEECNIKLTELYLEKNNTYILK